MSLLDTLKADLLAARKQKNFAAIGTLSAFLGDLETASKKTGRPIDDAQIVSLAKARISALTEVIKIVSPDGANEKAVKAYTADINRYKKYVPEQLTEDQIRLCIELLQDEYDDLKLGTVQGYFKANYPGRYDGKLVTEIFKEMTD